MADKVGGYARFRVGASFCHRDDSRELKDGDREFSSVTVEVADQGGTVALNSLTHADFTREVEDAKGRVVVDFYADWCGPCHQVAPALEELAAKWEGEIRFVKVNIDNNPQLAQTYRVLSIPMIMLFEDGKVVAQTVGALPAHVIEHDLKLDKEHAA